MRSMLQRLSSGLIAAALAAVSLFHGVALCLPSWDAFSPNPPWRHALFALVSLFFSLGFLKQVQWLWVPTALLACQQLQSHGTALLEAQHQGRTDLASLVVVLAMPVLFGAAWAQRRAP